MRIPDGISYYLLAIIWLNEDAYTLYTGAKSTIVLALLRGGSASRAYAECAACQ